MRIAPWRTELPPMERARAGGLGMVVFSPTRSALHPAPLAEALRHRHCARSAAVASNQCERSLLILWRVAHVRLPRIEPADRPRSTRALATVVWLSSRPTRARSTPHRCRGSFSPTPRQVGGCGCGTTWPQQPIPVPRGPRALRPVENRPAAHRARARWRAWRGCLRSQHGARSNPRHWSRLFVSDTAPCWRMRLRNVVIIAYRSRGAWPARASPRKEPADHPRSTRAGGLGVVIFTANAGRAPPYAVGRSSSSPTPRQDGGCNSE